MSDKIIDIKGTHNRYMVKKFSLMEEKKINRLKTNSWDFNMKYLNYPEQLDIVVKYKNDCLDTYDEKHVWSIMEKEINNKISSYKQQDNLKGKLDNEKLITFNHVIDQIIKSNLRCFYCNIELYILYEKLRYNKQWTVDRIDNNFGHNRENFYITCLECNLNRGKMDDKKYKFTKQLTINKI